MSSSLISGVKTRYYHSIPSSLDIITSSPERETIFKFIAQIGFRRFPEFILDILVKVEGHQPVDITDGPGDEKQDILTLNKSGDRCLIQCKHSVDYKKHYSGDELDRIVAACSRKDCNEAIFITNSDLSPQAKNYVNDKEYSRGHLSDITIDYWNGARIWERIKSNKDIMNKWFSGLGQTHGLRSFKFDLTVQKFPYSDSKENDKNSFDKMLSILQNAEWAEEIEKGIKFKIDLAEDMDVTVSRWFQFPDALNLNYILPKDDIDFINRPQFAFSTEIAVRDTIRKFSVQDFRDRFIQALAEKVLPATDAGQWWHLTVSQSIGFIYIHEIGEPREIDLLSATTFVKVQDSLTQPELDHCIIPINDSFSCIDDEESMFFHKASGIRVVQMFEQKLSPIEVYHYQLEQLRDLKGLSDHNFYAVDGISAKLMIRARALLKHDWSVFQYGESTIVWAVPQEIEVSLRDNYHSQLVELGLEVKSVDSNEVMNLIKGIGKDIQPAIWMYVSEPTKLSFPVLLDKRIMWLTKDFEVKGGLTHDLLAELLVFKLTYESKHGYEYMSESGKVRLSDVEGRKVLFDPMTIRGTRMLDVGVANNRLSINLRICEAQIASSLDLTELYLPVFEQVFDEITSLCP